jgi:probable HAF family extracellular repeat protein
MQSALQAGRIAALAVVLMLAGPVAALAADVLIDLGTLGGFSTLPGGINAAGHVVGGSATVGVGTVRAFVWTPGGGMVSIGTLGGNAYANAINASGVVVGQSPTSSASLLDKAFRWTQAGGMVSLGTLPTGSISRAFGINSGGQIVGEANVTSPSFAFRAFLLNPGGTMQNLGTLPDGGSSVARAINDDGHVVGSAIDSNGQRRAFLWTQTSGVMQDLGALEGDTSSTAYGINAAGRVVGWSTLVTLGDEVDRAVVWDPSVPELRELLMPLGGVASRAYGIDDLGRVVGEVLLSDGSLRGALWDATGKPRVLGLLLGGSYSVALGISASGHVVGQASNSDGDDHAVRWQLNVPPTAVDQGVTTAQDTPVAFNVTASDADGDQLSYTVVSGPSHGTLSGNLPAGTYTPAAGYTGPDSFTFRVNDGTEDSPVATVSITVTRVNHAPAADDLSVSTPADTPVPITVTGSDPDGDPVSFVLVDGPAHGSLSGGLPTPTYTPGPGYTGADSFTFRVDDGSAQSGVATVSITVTRVNHAPAAADQAVSTAQDLPVGITATGSDPDGDGLTFALVTGPAHGSLSGTLPAVTYTPAPGYSGGDGFTFRVNDGTADSNIATVAITVTAVTPPADTLEGRMSGEGGVRVAGQQHQFVFQVRSGPAGSGGSLVYALGANRFASTGLTRVTFSDGPGSAPGSHAVADTVVFAGLGTWNGQPGHSFEARATDAGEPGVGHDVFEVTIRSLAGAVVATAGGLLSSGNIQSNRVQSATTTTASKRRR